LWELVRRHAMFWSITWIATWWTSRLVCFADRDDVFCGLAPKRIWRFEDERQEDRESGTQRSRKRTPPADSKAWLPLDSLVLVLLWDCLA